jgi:FkbM family methyltransferase
LRQIEIRVRRFDELDIKPDAIMIDVKGCELEVLKGMTKTLDACRPILLLERNEDSPACKHFLRKYA